MQNCAIAKEKAERIQSLYLNELTPKLLRLSQIKEKLCTETEKLAASYRPRGKNAVFVPLPQVMQLEEECRNYLYEAKNLLRDLLQVFNLLFGTSFEEASEWTMQKKPRPSVIEYAEANFQAQPDHIRYLKQLPACIEPFVRMRNAVEPPGGHNDDLVIQNFHFEPDGMLAAPDWRRDEGGTTEYGPLFIVEDMRIGVHNLFVLAEDVLVMWAVDHAAIPGLMEMTVIPEGERNPACPIKYKMGVPPHVLGSAR
ncbi:hypothetical protein QA635_04215 [Bradyrhizobium brasilense]|uniref:hypothetical protein n=1 Tax=Bradyrhizobium brasilense TaxID=1419277 RepID=UPI0024B16770|nr:hypothetical protein [Bradyrhizobium australafricanum]WFU33660.1 hypothetical protein QA635_04215 [Bradyrhizobium australafricanum]